MVRDILYEQDAPLWPTAGPAHLDGCRVETPAGESRQGKTRKVLGVEPAIAGHQPIGGSSRVRTDHEVRDHMLSAPDPCFALRAPWSLRGPAFTTRKDARATASIRAPRIARMPKGSQSRWPHANPCVPQELVNPAHRVKVCPELRIDDFRDNDGAQPERIHELRLRRLSVDCIRDQHIDEDVRVGGGDHRPRISSTMSSGSRPARCFR